MKTIIGLGNPDSNYQNNRHNLGHQFVAYLSQELSIKLQNKKKILAQIGQDGRKKFLLAIPTTYMNESGLAVQKIVNFYKINFDNLYIVHDDLDLELGNWKIQFNRGSAGHNGIKSIIQNLNSRQFWRIRIGIGHPLPPIPVENFVLQNFSNPEKVIINQTIKTISQKILTDIIGPIA
ncbi:aminoacyl-tRNA hydrolase [Candidatus Shapirobacteria bacterium]|nr:MAG: aminoacyl-tRNA hydrolase [Candidatus Shapirobacteria bacterium]